MPIHPELVALLATAAGQAPLRGRAHELVAGFDWARVPRQDRLAHFEPVRGLTIE